MLLTHDALHLLQKTGVMQHGRADAVGASSVDIHLGSRILVEREPAPGKPVTLDYSKRTPVCMDAVDLDHHGWVLQPGQFILAHSVEILNMPNDLSALLRTKSSMGRIGFEHMDAGWIDPGFHGALTLEFTNQLQRHSIRIRPGDPVGQLVFFHHAQVPAEASYRARGRYNGSDTVEQVRQCQR